MGTSKLVSLGYHLYFTSSPGTFLLLHLPPNYSPTYIPNNPTPNYRLIHNPLHMIHPHTSIPDPPAPRHIHHHITSKLVAAEMARSRHPHLAQPPGFQHSLELRFQHGIVCAAPRVPASVRAYQHHRVLDRRPLGSWGSGGGRGMLGRREQVLSDPRLKDGGIVGGDGREVEVCREQVGAGGVWGRTRGGQRRVGDQRWRERLQQNCQLPPPQPHPSSRTQITHVSQSPTPLHLLQLLNARS